MKLPKAPFGEERQRLWNSSQSEYRPTTITNPNAHGCTAGLVEVGYLEGFTRLEGVPKEGYFPETG